jgi:PadR family transcriptional regulator PadR
MKDLTKTEEILLLTIWQLKDEAYGVRIRNRISELIGKDFTYGNLYSALKQLTKKKYVVKNREETLPVRRGWQRMYYSLSPDGKNALTRACEVNEKIWSGVSKYVFKLNSR